MIWFIIKAVFFGLVLFGIVYKIATRSQEPHWKRPYGKHTYKK